MNRFVLHSVTVAAAVFFALPSSSAPRICLDLYKIELPEFAGRKNLGPVERPVTETGKKEDKLIERIQNDIKAINLSQSEMAYIMEVVVGHPSMLFGDLGNSIRTMKPRNKWGNEFGFEFQKDLAMFYNLRKTAYEKAKRLDSTKLANTEADLIEARRIFADVVLGVLRAVNSPGTAPIVERNVTIEAVPRTYKTSRPNYSMNEVSKVTVDRSRFSDQERADLDNFMKWLNNSYPREAYLRNLLELSADGFFSTFPNASFQTVNRVARNEIAPNKGVRGILEKMGMAENIDAAYRRQIEIERIDIGVKAFAIEVRELTANQLVSQITRPAVAFKPKQENSGNDGVPSIPVQYFEPIAQKLQMDLGFLKAKFEVKGELRAFERISELQERTETFLEITSLGASTFKTQANQVEAMKDVATSVIRRLKDRIEDRAQDKTFNETAETEILNKHAKSILDLRKDVEDVAEVVFNVVQEAKIIHQNADKTYGDNPAFKAELDNLKETIDQLEQITQRTKEKNDMNFVQIVGAFRKARGAILESSGTNAQENQAAIEQLQSAINSLE